MTWAGSITWRSVLIALADMEGSSLVVGGTFWLWSRSKVWQKENQLAFLSYGFPSCWVICPVVAVADSFPEIRTNIFKLLLLIRDQRLSRNLPCYQCLEKMPLRFSIAMFLLILLTVLIWIWQLHQNISITWVFVLLLTACRTSKIQQSLYF